MGQLKALQLNKLGYLGDNQHCAQLKYQTKCAERHR